MIGPFRLALVLGLTVAGVAHAQEAPTSAPTAVSLSRHLVASGVEKTEPVGPADTFSAASTPQLVCFLEMANRSGGETPIKVNWYVGDKLHYAQPIRLQPGPRTRTWARLKLTPRRAGSWRCEVEDGQGAKLGSVAFTVTE